VGEGGKVGKKPQSIYNLRASQTSSSSPPDFTCTYDKKVLSIEIPGVAQNIIYYTRPVSDNSVWRGPHAAYRWGPGFDENDEYNNSNSPGDWSCPDNPEEKGIFIDSLAAPRRIPPPPTCSNGDDWTLNEGVGFYSYVNCDANSAKIFMYGKLSESDSTYSVSTQVFSRSQ
jgi:hypothetical protein